MSETEIWKDIPGYEGLYQVSSLGRVKSLDRVNSRGHKQSGKILKVYKSNKPMTVALRIKLYSQGKVYTVAIKNLVAAAFIKEYHFGETGVWCVDGDEENCALSNLTIDPMSVPLPSSIALALGEQMKDVDGYDDKYTVTNKGKVLDKPRVDKCGVATGWKLRKPHHNGYGYASVQFRNGSEKKHWLVHRLVATAFIPNPYNKPYVDHIDTNPTNNSVENLRWVDLKENMNNEKTLKKRAKKVVITSCEDAAFLKEFSNTLACAKYFGVTKATVSRWATGKCTPRKYPNLIFKYTEVPSVKKTIKQLAHCMNSMTEQQCIAELQEYLQEVATS